MHAEVASEVREGFALGGQETAPAGHAGWETRWDEGRHKGWWNGCCSGLEPWGEPARRRS